jgi:hypothetical protein
VLPRVLVLVPLVLLVVLLLGGVPLQTRSWESPQQVPASTDLAYRSAVYLLGVAAHLLGAASLWAVQPPAAVAPLAAVLEQGRQELLQLRAEREGWCL